MWCQGQHKASHRSESFFHRQGRLNNHSCRNSVRWSDSIAVYQHDVLCIAYQRCLQLRSSQARYFGRYPQGQRITQLICHTARSIKTSYAFIIHQAIAFAYTCLEPLTTFQVGHTLKQSTGGEGPKVVTLF